MKKLLLALTFCVFIASPAYAKGYELSLSHTYPNSHVLTKWLENWAVELEKKTDGQLVVNLFPNSSLIKTEDQTTAVRDGAVDIAIVGSNAPNLLPRISLFSMPFLIRDAEHGTKLAMLLQEHPDCKPELEKLGIPFISWSSTIAAISSPKAPIRSPDDLKGKRTIIWFPTQVDEVKAWGGVPIVTIIPDTYVALQRGMGDAIYCQIPPITNMKLTELVKYVTPMPSQTMLTSVVMNKDAFASLPIELQKVLRDSLSYEQAIEISKLIEADGQRTLDKCRELGIEVIELTPENILAFKETARAAQKSYFLNTLEYAKVPDPEGWYNQIIYLSDSIQ